MAPDGGRGRAPPHLPFLYPFPPPDVFLLPSSFITHSSSSSLPFLLLLPSQLYPLPLLLTPFLLLLPPPFPFSLLLLSCPPPFSSLLLPPGCSPPPPPSSLPSSLLGSLTLALARGAAGSWRWPRRRRDGTRAGAQEPRRRRGPRNSGQVQGGRALSPGAVCSRRPSAEPRGAGGGGAGASGAPRWLPGGPCGPRPRRSGCCWR